MGLLERDPDETAATLTRWLVQVVGVEDPAVDGVHIPASTGWSNETIFFEATLHGHRRRLVARIAPSGYQVFPDDTFLRQHAVMRALAAQPGVPMPAIHHFEADPSWFGRPFWTMGRVDGDVATDVPPYSSAGWIFDSSPDQQAEVWWAGIDAMAAVHRVDLDALDLPSGTLPAPDGDTVGHHLDHYERFLTWAEDGTPFDLARRALDELRATRPAEPPGGPALVWGDARLSNLIYRDRQVVAVLDWEMCGVGDPLQDLGYWLFADRALTLGSGNRPLPGFPSWEETAERWSALTGRSADALDWYVRFGGLRFTVILLRMGGLLHGIGFVDEAFARDNLISQHLADLLG